MHAQNGQSRVRISVVEEVGESCLVQNSNSVQVSQENVLGAFWCCWFMLARLIPIDSARCIRSAQRGARRAPASC